MSISSRYGSKSLQGTQGHAGLVGIVKQRVHHLLLIHVLIPHLVAQELRVDVVGELLPSLQAAEELPEEGLPRLALLFPLLLLTLLRLANGDILPCLATDPLSTYHNFII